MNYERFVTLNFLVPGAIMDYEDGLDATTTTVEYWNLTGNYTFYCQEIPISEFVNFIHFGLVVSVSSNMTEYMFFFYFSLSLSLSLSLSRNTDILVPRLTIHLKKNQWMIKPKKNKA